jgi:hypothetical protein
MKKVIIFFLFFFPIIAYAQSTKSKFDCRFGVGSSFLGSGDMRGVMFENELNFTPNTHLAVGLSVGYGKSDEGVYVLASFIESNANVYLSPFKNNKRNDFRLGAGISYFTVSDSYLSSMEWTGNVLIDADYEFDLRSSYGLNFIIEDSYMITDKFLLGLKIYTQSYFNGDINSGLMLKIGMKI